MSERSATIDGGDIPVTNSITAVGLVEYQCLASHGHVAVSDATAPTTVTYFPGKAVLKAPSASVKKGRVHLPVHDTPEVVDKTYALYHIRVNFEIESEASVDFVTVYYDSTKVVSTDVNKKNTFHVDFTANEAMKYKYDVLAGIAVTLDLSFPDPKSAINLYSVTLVYKAI
ncbi:hypothetical protein CDD83_2821 [Cordyceps sp. RAO-2017]|nr:hypothetical protein CDD83_2821 [Cordyceps sp. RAO-2017]